MRAAGFVHLGTIINLKFIFEICIHSTVEAGSNH